MMPGPASIPFWIGEEGSDKKRLFQKTGTICMLVPEDSEQTTEM